RFAPTERTTLKRLPKRGEYDRKRVYAILDEAFICHVGFIVGGQPVVIPTGYGRIGDVLYIHGSAASRMLRTLSEGIDVCVTATPIDDEADHALPVWAGVLPLRLATGEPIDDEQLRAGIALSQSVRDYRRPQQNGK